LISVPSAVTNAKNPATPMIIVTHGFVCQALNPRIMAQAANSRNVQGSSKPNLISIIASMNRKCEANDFLKSRNYYSSRNTSTGLVNAAFTE